MTRPALPWLLGANGGYVDTISFLSLHGLFATHVTGNFVTLGAALVLGTGGALAKLLALPVFCAVVWATRLIAVRVMPAPASLRVVLVIKIVLLIGAALFALRFGPFQSGEGWAPLVTGMLLVAAMAIQNAIHRTHFTQLAPTTVMTGNTTQFMIDIADLVHGVAPEARASIRLRTRRLGFGILTFAGGCALGALLYDLGGMGCFLVPPLLALFTLLLAQSPPPQASAERPG